MHMLMVMLAGILLLGVFLLFGWLWGHSLAGVATGAKVFLPAWLIVATVNLWVGVSRAGYTVMQELPILAANFAVPAAIAVLAAWQVSRA
ncbi:hypothetical protein [Roseomonas fluvialis]|uniref:Uncharacterized protein n=1 Tax=Roseomonas fluvialis TaxID=1750527 RepID=A0ABN6P0H3_9PROT|nr:hypothetical protein [Roseomonas fluvialis]BDG72144.1 hypothetical protein Rmf_20730 [Roseomonas fluvialis]